MPSEIGPRALRHPGRTDTGRAPRDTLWPAALAIMLVANLAAPASSDVPRSAFPPDDSNEATEPRFRALDAGARPAVETPISPVPDDVIVRPVQHSSPIKSEYSFQEFLKAVSTASAPFHHLGESVGEAYEVLSGQTVGPDVRSGVRRGADALDVATGLLPQVRLTRLPGDLAGIVGDELEGKTFNPEKLVGILQFADPRTLESGPHLHADSRVSMQSPPVPRPAESAQMAPHSDASRAEPGSESVDAANAQDAPPPVSGLANDPALASPLRIVGEQEHLQGYAQILTADQLPAGRSSRVVLVDGHHYLKGEAGYYQAQQGISADHWLVDAPKGSDKRAQVPVTYDESTGEWQAHAPLRLCGGGCSSSKVDFPSDSIVDSVEDVARAIHHIPDEVTREAIPEAFITLGGLHLRRSNRADLQALRDNSIINHRAALRADMRERIDPNLPLIKQQCIASEITAMYYSWNTAAEAFCQENAEILFFNLRQNGLSRSQIRMITIKPKNRPPHVMVLYSDSKHFIKLMDRTTPQPPNVGHPDGISHELFREAVYLTRQSTVLLDPWSTTKAISFAGARNRIDAGRIINRALIDIGHTPGNPYTVSVTRPLGIHRVTVRERGNSVNSDSVSSQSAASPTSRGGSPMSGDSLTSQQEYAESSN
ncbi:hypothetical protein [Pandoraea horticolens]|uniref:hypothetical protein n=1 Tax=Pandoraea horticolens TaxID=2508298 RepID=UPI0012423D39|nr:hypothetical protein [Pandoraea horticolens]